MKKTLTVNLNQNLFNIDEDAYSKLSEYLDSIKKHFAKTQDSEEIVSDIEARIAEKFLEKTALNKSIIVITDVEEIIASMGTVADLSRDEETEDSENTDIEDDTIQTRKKLFRDPKDKVIGGVASGLATYFGFDTIVVRLIFIILALVPYTSGVSIIGYIILLFIVPIAKNTADRLIMKGETVTLSKIENMVNSKFSESKDKESRLSRLILLPFRVIGNFLPTLGRIIKFCVASLSSIIGFCLVIGIAISIGGLVFVLVQALVNGSIFINGSNLLTTIPSPQLQIIVISTFFIALFPLIFVLQLGVTLLQRRSAFSLVSGLTSFFLWIIAIIVLCAAAVNIAPQLSSDPNFTKSFSGFNLNYQTNIDDNNFDSILVTDFDQIDVSSVKEIVVNQSSDSSVTVFGSSEYLDKVQIQVEESILKIKPIHGLNCVGFCFNQVLPIRVVINTPDLKSIQASGMTKVISDNLDLKQLSYKLSGASELTFSGSINDLLLDVSGASKITGQNLLSKSIEIKSSGASSINLSGNSDNLDISASGASKFDAQNLQTISVDLHSSGASTLKVSVSDQLKIDASGASKIQYLGNPQITQDISGASSVKPIF